ncbi:OmpP1/FadL family transporter [Fusobacterium mortiferum]|uniref:Outer membrane protein transport protein n=1 Tax=Fusobacterium mortiferum TaxID=850 RepID=A0ABS2G3N1_FUSMR|nr:outer membrane protein transport protein [Fusobacterium mortiferum]MBM6876031.1 outer membrane protein transport protein [Fusobacterium mortiferum]
MKKRLGLLALAAVLSSSAYSASIDHIQTYTPEYLGNQAQNGMINNASVYYNPAGLVHLQNGTYFHAGIELAVGEEKMNYNGQELKADLLQPIPNFAMYKVEDDSALFWTFGGIAGGGDLKYKDGVAGTSVIPDIVNPIGIQISNAITVRDLKDIGSSAEGKNIYAQTTLGKTWKVDDKLSLSAAGRVVYGVRKLKGNIDLESATLKKRLHADIDSERTAWGYGAQFGVNYKATERLNLAMRYDSRVKMNFKAKGSYNNVVIPKILDLGFGNFYPEYMPGTKTRRDLPAILAAGMSYKVTDNWTVALSGNYYFNKDAKMDRIKQESILGSKVVEAEYDNGWELAVGTEYRLSPKWAVLGSINYADTGAKVSSYDDVEYALNSVTLGTGLKYNPDETTEWVFTVAHFFYDSEKGHYDTKYASYKVPNPTYDKSITAFGVSYTKRF